MRVAVISDIHGNTENLETALLWGKELGISETWFLGDFVGGRKPDPKLLEVVREHSDISIAGNHDFAATGRFPQLLGFLSVWWKGTLNIQNIVGEENYEWLRSLPAEDNRYGVELYHGSREDPVMGFLNPAEAPEHLLGQNSYLSLVGHTHKPLAMWIDKDRFYAISPENNETLELKETGKYVLNPGTLGFQQNKSVSDRRSGWMMLEGDKNRFSSATWYRL